MYAAAPSPVDKEIRALKAELEQLVALQNVDMGIRRLQSDLESIPRRRAEIESEFDQRAFEFKALQQPGEPAHETRRRAFEEQTRAWTEELEERRRERERMFSALPPGIKATYQRIVARIRDGVALAEARNGACSACRMTLRPQLMAEIRRGDDVITCDNCNRILYYQTAAQPPQQGTSVSAT